MAMSIHLTNTRGLWFWSVTIDGQAFKACAEGYKSAAEAQSDARATITRYRAIMASMVA